MHVGLGDVFTWMRVEWRRAELYRKVGRTSEAQEVENKLRRLLVFADSDHSILLKLHRLSNAEKASL